MDSIQMLIQTDLIQDGRRILKGLLAALGEFLH